MAKKQNTTVADPEVLGPDDAALERVPPAVTALERTAKQGSSVMARLLQMSKDPGFDAVKINNLIDAHIRIQAIQAQAAFEVAFSAMQGEMRAVPKRGKGQSGKFSTFEDIMAMALPLMSKYAFSLRFRSKTADGILTTTGTLSGHGHSETDEFASRGDVGGNKNEVQEWGSARQYHRRYIAKNLLAIYDAEDHQNDVRSENKAQRRQESDRHDERNITHGTKEKPGQTQRLHAIIRSAHRTPEEVREWLFGRYGYSTSKEIKRFEYDSIIEAIQKPGPLPVDDARDPGEEG